ncbi:hypothetical protein HS5_07490 [Acidianus sp. HS-5]|nr:hypothetical protein HS5_07490 [Acidianus sp. HS-5]
MLRDYNFIKTVEEALGSLGVEYLELPEWDKIVENVRKYRIDIEDTIHVATAFENVLSIISNDDELKRKVKTEF